MVGSWTRKPPAAALAALVMIVLLFLSLSASAQDQPLLAATSLAETTDATLPPPLPQCDATTAGGSVKVTRSGPQPSCEGCRSFHANITAVCSNETYGYELTYRMGRDRGDIVVESCPDDDTVTFRTVPQDTDEHYDDTPFTRQEVSFFGKIADDIELNRRDDVNATGTLESFVIATSRTLAAWPSDQFPVNGAYYPSETPFWFESDVFSDSLFCAAISTVCDIFVRIRCRRPTNPNYRGCQTFNIGANPRNLVLRAEVENLLTASVVLVADASATVKGVFRNLGPQLGAGTEIQPGVILFSAEFPATVGDGDIITATATATFKNIPGGNCFHNFGFTFRK